VWGWAQWTRHGGVTPSQACSHQPPSPTPATPPHSSAAHTPCWTLQPRLLTSWRCLAQISTQQPRLERRCVPRHLCSCLSGHDGVSPCICVALLTLPNHRMCTGRWHCGGRVCAASAAPTHRPPCLPGPSLRHAAGARHRRASGPVPGDTAAPRAQGQRRGPPADEGCAPGSKWAVRAACHPAAALLPGAAAGARVRVLRGAQRDGNGARRGGPPPGSVRVRVRWQRRVPSTLLFFPRAKLTPWLVPARPGHGMLWCLTSSSCQTRACMPPHRWSNPQRCRLHLSTQSLCRRRRRLETAAMMHLHHRHRRRGRALCASGGDAS
jgi:hypothetical protein